MVEEKTKSPWLERAVEAYESSTTYFDANYRKKIEEGISHFRGQHAAGSKYNSPAYKYRSKMFRPKTRASIRNNEAALVAAFFSNKDVVAIDPMNPDNPVSVASARLNNELINYRLTTPGNNGIPWFLTVIGAFQDAMTTGVCVSRQDWRYREKPAKYEQPIVDPMTGMPLIGEDGMPVMEVVTENETVEDRPCITLLPVENIRFHPAADWTDPINSSPYLIELIPMMVQDVKARMTEADEKTGEPKWKKLSDKEIASAKKEVYDSTRNEREDREDKYDEKTGTVSEFDIVFVHRNIMRIDGDDYLFYTLGTEHLLSEPVPISEASPVGRNYAMGCCIVETHKVIPDGLAQIGAPIQREIVENVNQRLDNVKLVLNKRWFARRGSQIDIDSLMRNAPGSVTMLNDPQGDIREVNWPDVTSSAYQEQDRLNLDYDEVTGTFSPSTIQTNRAMNETVGGMSMLRGNTNLATLYLIRTFNETWVEPVLRQLVKLEQAFETDEKILALTGEKAGLFREFGVQQITQELLEQDMLVTVNVGMDATDPQNRLSRLMFALNTMAQIEQTLPPGYNREEIRKEVFAQLGYKDGGRFIDSDSEMQAIHQQYEQQIQQLTQMIQQLQQDQSLKAAEMQSRQEIEQMRQNSEMARAMISADTEEMKTRASLMNPVAGERPFF